jgi:cell wall assembly regulator SMI1
MRQTTTLIASVSRRSVSLYLALGLIGCRAAAGQQQAMSAEDQALKHKFRGLDGDLAPLLKQAISCLPVDAEEIERSLAAPATEADLVQLHHAAKHRLPPSLVELYRYCDGERRRGDDQTIGVFFDYLFIGSKQAVKEIAVLRWAAEFWKDSMCELDLHSDPPGAVQRQVYVDGWFPFASDSGGNYLAVDMAPDINGTAGQIILFGRDEPVNCQLAPDMRTFLEFVASCYRARRFHSLLGEDFYSTDELMKAARSGIEPR